MGIDFRPEPCGLNSRRACQKRRESQREREKESKKERQKGGRKPPQTSIWQNEGAGLTLTTSDMCKLCEEKEEERKKKCWNNSKTKGEKLLLFSPLCGCLFYIFNKEINAHIECVRWATICRRSLMCSLQPPLKFCTSSRNKGNKIRG